MVETNDQWIVERTGIRERHLVDPGVATSDLAYEAAKCCLAKRGVDAEGCRGHHCCDGDSGHAVSGDGLPGAGEAGISQRVGFRSFGGVFRLSLCVAGGAKLVESGMHKKVLVIGADVMSSIIDYTDRATRA